MNMNDFIKDDIDRRIIDYIQLNFPLVTKPFKAIGEIVNTGEADIIRRIQNLKKQNIIRFIGPILDAQKIGYRTTLIAMTIPDKYLKMVETLIRGHPSISHAYWREHSYNLWITYAVPQYTSMDKEVDNLAQIFKSTDTLSLPAIRVFKRMAYFNTRIMDYDFGPNRATYTYSGDQVRLTGLEKTVLNLLQQDLLLTEQPYNEIANTAGMELEDFLSLCRSLMKRKIVLRYCAAVNHRKIGYAANAMACWKAPVEKLDNIANEIVKMDQVSHCYERNTGERWPYNLYAMFHGRTKAICHDLIDRFSLNNGLKDYLTIFSTHEIKKVRITYRV